jgi:DNA-binding CsgD family transcriptional regulator
LDDHSRPIPEWIEVYARRVRAARGDPAEMRAVLEESTVPMMLVDDERRYVYANPPALRLFGRTLEELRELRLDDVAGSYRRSVMRPGRESFLASEFVLGHESPRFGMANVLPGRHVIAFAPSDAPAGAGAPDLETRGPHPEVLTPRELEVLALAAGGLDVRAIAEELVLARGTVKAHFANIYRKLEVSGRAGAVAKGLRLGLIR